jgi:hypothetical protein
VTGTTQRPALFMPIRPWCSRLERPVAPGCRRVRFEDHIEIRSRFRLRDSQIEHIGWALMAEAQRGYPSGRPSLDSMATVLAVQLLRNHSSVAGMRSQPEDMPRHKLLKCNRREPLRQYLAACRCGRGRDERLAP